LRYDPAAQQDLGNVTKEVIEYLEEQKSPQKEIAQRLRTIVLETLPGIKERLWMGVALV
jgi:cytochrome c1